MYVGVENECIRKKFQKCRTKDFLLLGIKKESIFWEFSLDVNF
jgi:hypothetical protein